MRLESQEWAKHPHKRGPQEIPAPPPCDQGIPGEKPSPDHAGSLVSDSSFQSREL